MRIKAVLTPSSSVISSGSAAFPAWTCGGVFSGEARQVAKLFLVIHLLMTLAFLLAWRAGRRAQVT
jgi:hypothetical protein